MINLARTRNSTEITTKEALDYAYQHYDRTSDTYDESEDLTGVSLADVQENERMLTRLHHAWKSRTRRGGYRFTVIMALADRNRAMVDALNPNDRQQLSNSDKYRRRSARADLPAIAFLQHRSTEELNSLYSQQSEKSKTEALAVCWKSAPVHGLVTGVDLETTDGNPLHGYIINTGWKQLNINITAQPTLPHTYMSGLPARYANAEIPFSEVHHITWNDIKNFIAFRKDLELQKNLLDDLKGHPLMAHNASFEDAWLTFNLNGYAEARKNNEIQIIDSMLICQSLEGLKKGRGVHTLENWARRRGVLDNTESERHLGLEDTDLMLRTVTVELTKAGIIH